jgi:hypothetical protein
MGWAPAVAACRIKLTRPPQSRLGRAAAPRRGGGSLGARLALARTLMKMSAHSSLRMRPHSQSGQLAIGRFRQRGADQWQCGHDHLTLLHFAALGKNSCSPPIL